ncbi:hypothetical protein COLO4_30905 [Corchorus olitorius]|uniref:GIR1-like zinc ribbon domain-containing protein n=1 Tax=Corchorus olitorius TaxID=93759 RepID=A0A1R3H6I6_9ROSI|nr:hypothetical protein COLO4_30905 [Corchorus olitorius]
MAAEVSSSSLVRVLNGHIEEQGQIHGGNSDILITQDLLGSLSKAATKEIVDLEFKPGKFQTQIGNSPKSPLSSTSPSASSSSSADGKNKNQIIPNPFQDSKLQDLNFPPNPINFFEDTSLDLKLQSNSTPTSCYQSVCTLDKVKFALERAEKLETMKKRSSSPPLSAAATSSSASSNTPGMFAAACPGCLLYVIASNTNPRCPRCNSLVPSVFAAKKPKIDLNASF